MAYWIILKTSSKNYQIVEEINRRFVEEIKAKYPGDQEKVRKMAIIYDGQVKMLILQLLPDILLMVLQSFIQKS